MTFPETYDETQNKAQRQRDIEQLAREILAQYGNGPDAMALMFTTAEAFYVQLDKRRAGK